MSIIPEMDDTNLRYAKSGHLVILCRYLAIQFDAYFIYGKPLWTEYSSAFADFDMFKCNDMSYRCGQVTLCSSVKSGFFIARNATHSSEKYNALAQVVMRSSYYRKYWLEAAIRQLDKESPLLTVHKLAILHSGDDLLYAAAFGTERSARRTYPFVSMKEIARTGKKKYIGWVKKMSANAVRLFNKSGINQNGTRDFPDLESAIFSIVEDIANMSSDKVQSLRFEVPESEVYIKDIVRESLRRQRIIAERTR